MTLPGTPPTPDVYRERPRRPSPDERFDLRDRVAFEPTILCLCTGNAARSPMAQLLLSDALPGANVRSAGTHVVDGQPVSWRTRLGLEVVRPDLAVRLGVHRSHQVTSRDLESADLVLCMASEHVEFVRRTFPAEAGRAGTIRRLARELPAGHLASLGPRVEELHLDRVALAAWEDVDDPAGGDVEDFARCAIELNALVSELASRMAMHRLG